jgi:hypothetical protein
MKNYIILIVSSIFLFSSCEKMKNNRAERKLEGVWELVKSEYGDQEVDLTGRVQTLTFYDSNDKEYYEETEHNGLMTNSYNGFTYYIDFKYAVVEKGKELNLTMEFNSPQEATIFPTSKAKLTKLNGDKFIMEAENADGFTSKFTFKRIK